MFQIGDTVVCGSNGVCVIEEIGPILNMGKSAASRGDYYTLMPYFDKGGRIYLPVDNDKVIMRYLLSKEEVNDLINNIDTLEQIEISNEKLREAEYKNAVNSSDPRKLIQIIKTMYYRRKSRIDSGKKSTAIDEKYFRIAEQRLYDELALALNLERDNMKDYIKRYIEAEKKLSL